MYIRFRGGIIPDTLEKVFPVIEAGRIKSMLNGIRSISGKMGDWHMHGRHALWSYLLLSIYICFSTWDAYGWNRSIINIQGDGVEKKGESRDIFQAEDFLGDGDELLLLCLMIFHVV
jgi:hypothetical protein